MFKGQRALNELTKQSLDFSGLLPTALSVNGIDFGRISVVLLERSL